MTKPIYAAIKKATVAIVVSHPESIPRKPFTIVGSGFCIHPEGIVATCEHVFRSFVRPESYQRVMQAVSRNESEAFELKGAALRRLSLPRYWHGSAYDSGSNQSTP